MKKLQLSTLIKISLLGAISFIIMWFDFPVGFAPGFYKMDFSDLPALLGSFALGPMAGVLIELLKNILHFVIKGSSTAGVGEIANFLSGGLFVVTAGLIYKRKKTRKNALIGMLAGTLAMAVLGSLLNYYVLIPTYSKAFNLPIEQILGMAEEISKKTMTLKSLVIYMVFPFNILKGVLVSALTIPLYKRLSSILSK